MSKGSTLSPAQVAPGVWKVTIGDPEKFTPVGLRDVPPAFDAMSQLPADQPLPLDTNLWETESRETGLLIRMPYPTSPSYGLGLQLKSVNQAGKKKTLRVNSDPVADTGDSHAPVPLLVSLEGFAILVDTARYATFYVASHDRNGQTPAATTQTKAVATSTDELYAIRRQDQQRQLEIFIPGVRGVEIYVIAGPTPMQAVQRYNLFSGGGAMPPVWGLGVWYRMYGRATEQDTLAMARQFRERHLPCDVLGLEPGWQTHAYSCSYVWNTGNFPTPETMTSDLAALGYHVNLWEHVFVHPSSPIHEALRPHSGEHLVWGGLVPDLSLPEARDVFSSYHDDTFVSRGISGFKLDECDNSDFIKSPWSFPEHGRFPSGMDGEQMHSLLGMLYQRSLGGIFRKRGRRTYSQVRSSHALAAPQPFVLYSDLYDHRDFVRAIPTAGFCGLLWSPEVRHAASAEDLVRRLQTVVLSPQALVNAWYIKNPPWFQIEREKNNQGCRMDGAEQLEALCRTALQLRMKLLPYLYSAFARYWREGLPPFRAMVLDYPADERCHAIDDQYMAGDDLLVAPLFAGNAARDVYLPQGDWYCFFTHRRYVGGRSHHVEHGLETFPLFVRSGAVLPLAEVRESCPTPEEAFRVNPLVFGAGDRPAVLHEDDGVSFDFESGSFSTLTLRWNDAAGGSVQRDGHYAGRLYEIGEWALVR